MATPLEVTGRKTPWLSETQNERYAWNALSGDTRLGDRLPQVWPLLMLLRFGSVREPDANGHAYSTVITRDLEVAKMVIY